MVLMKEFVLSLNKKTLDFQLSNCPKVQLPFMTDPLNIIFGDFSIRYTRLWI